MYWFIVDAPMVIHLHTGSVAKPAFCTDLSALITLFLSGFISDLAFCGGRGISPLFSEASAAFKPLWELLPSC
jgi:hypothetical protein